jgi:hypothetical protein
MCIATWRFIRTRSPLTASHKFGDSPYDGKATRRQVRKLERDWKGLKIGYPKLSLTVSW